MRRPPAFPGRFLHTNTPPSNATPRPGFVFRVMNLVQFAPMHLLAGTALGGLTATIGGTLYYLHVSGTLDLWQLFGKLDRMDIKIKHRKGEQGVDDGAAGGEGGSVQEDEEEDEHSFYIPMPLLMPLVGWSSALLFATVVAWSRARANLSVRNFFHQTGFFLCSPAAPAQAAARPGSIVLRKIAKRDVKTVVYGNEVLRSMVERSAWQTSNTNPVIALPRAHADVVVSGLRTEISEKFTRGFFLADQQFPHVEKRHHFALTTCTDSEEHFMKLRTLIFSEDTLRQARADGVAQLTDGRNMTATDHAFWSAVKQIIDGEDIVPNLDADVAQLITGTVQVVLPVSAQPSDPLHTMLA